MSDRPGLLGGFAPSTFGELNAADYDALHDPGTTGQSVELIASLLQPGASVLELAIGTGRIALPLAERGFAVSGIDGSPEMVELMRAKPGGGDIPAVIGDFADVEIEGTFDHACLVFNTLFNLTSQDAQVRCFANVAKKLNPGGSFLVETFVPEVAKLSDGQHVRTMRLDMGSVWLEAAIHDRANQTLEMQRVRITPDGVRLVPLPMRYAFPAEIDLMARLAGFTLEHRWGDWDKSPFTARSEMHVSVYRLT